MLLQISVQDIGQLPYLKRWPCEHGDVMACDAHASNIHLFALSMQPSLTNR